MLKENVCLKMLFAILCCVFVNTIFQPWIIEKFTLEGLTDIIFYFIYFSPFATKGGWMIDDKGWSAMSQKQGSCFFATLSFSWMFYNENMCATTFTPF